MAPICLQLNISKMLMRYSFVKVVLCLVGLGFALAGCKKTSIRELDKQPNIRIISVAPTTVQAFTGRTEVLLQYEDGDGDQGSLHPDSLMLEVRDDRLTAPDFYFVPPLSPEGSSVPIRGTIRFRLNGTFLFGNGATEVTQYSIRLRDRSGQWSNTVLTPQIIINRN